MANKKEHKIVSASTGQQVDQATIEQNKPVMTHAKPVGNASALRIGAIVLWVVALVFEILAIRTITGHAIIRSIPTMTQFIIYVVLDLICVIIGSQLWKKANHIRPASEKNKTLFWLWNNMGVLAALVCFFPLIILVLTNKDLDKKTKAIASVIAIIALLIGGVSSYDFNPVSQEQQQAAMTAISGNVFWTKYGHVYHTHEDCQALNQSDELIYGTVEEAIAANRTRLCSFCARKDDITGVVTDNVSEELLDAAEEAAATQDAA